MTLPFTRPEKYTWFLNDAEDNPVSSGVEMRKMPEKKKKFWTKRRRRQAEGLRTVAAAINAIAVIYLMIRSAT